MVNRISFVAILSLSLLAACSAAQPFDYEAATPEAREAWLRPRAETMNRGFKFGLEAGGAGGQVDVQPVKMDTGARRVTLAARFRLNGVSLNGQTATIKRQLLEQSCPSYLGSDFSKQDVKVVIELQRNGGSRLLSVVQTPESCRSALERKKAKNAAT